MTTTTIIEAAFQHLQSFVYSPQPEVIWPGLQSEPPEQGMWLQADMFPNEPTDMAWDNDACVDTRGFFQILVCFRPGRGLIEPSELADALVDHFPKGTALGPVRVRKRPWQAPVVIPDASTLYIPVTVAYSGLT